MWDVKEWKVDLINDFHMKADHTLAAADDIQGAGSEDMADDD